MKKIMFLLFGVMIVISSCVNEDKLSKEVVELQNEISKLEQIKSVLMKDVYAIRIEYNGISHKLDDARDENHLLTTMNDNIKIGKRPVYILELELKQSHVSFDISKHAKDAMNTIKFEMAVDKDLYDGVNAGDNIIDNFRSGSLLMDGSFGNWKMKVQNKKIKYIN